MEILSWVLQLKSHAVTSLSNLTISSQLSKALSLNDMQVLATFADSCILLAYLLLLTKPTPARYKVSFALFACLVIAYSPLYDALSQVQFYCLYSFVYIRIARTLTNKKIKYTLVIMSLFQLLVAMDSYVNPKTETWLFNSFEEITCCIHLLIVSSSVKFKPIDWREFLGRAITAMRGLSHHYGFSAGL